MQIFSFFFLISYQGVGIDVVVFFFHETKSTVGHAIFPCDPSFNVLDYVKKNSRYFPI